MNNALFIPQARRKGKRRVFMSRSENAIQVTLLLISPLTLRSQSDCEFVVPACSRPLSHGGVIWTTSSLLQAPAVDNQGSHRLSPHISAFRANNRVVL